MQKCVYCGTGEATTRDHIPSENLFPESFKKKNLITVPSDLECNKGFSLDEEYFRNFICAMALEHSKHAGEQFFSKIKRSILRRPWIGEKALEKMEKIRLFTKTGKYIGEKTKVDITEEDIKRYFNVLDKYIKGLYFHELKLIFSADYRIKHTWGSDWNPHDLTKILKQVSKRNTDNHEIFAYGYAVCNSDKFVWVTIFYNFIIFVSVVGPAKEFEHFEKQSLE